MSIKNKVKALRQVHLIQSLGWQGALEYIEKLSLEEKKDYFNTTKDEQQQEEGKAEK